MRVLLASGCVRDNFNRVFDQLTTTVLFSKSAWKTSQASLYKAVIITKRIYACMSCIQLKFFIFGLDACFVFILLLKLFYIIYLNLIYRLQFITAARNKHEVNIFTTHKQV